MLDLISVHLEVDEYSWVEDNNEGGEDFDCSLHIFENVSIDFINFFANEFIDYDQSKHKNFWYFTEEEVKNHQLIC